MTTIVLKEIPSEGVSPVFAGDRHFAEFTATGSVFVSASGRWRGVVSLEDGADPKPHQVQFRTSAADLSALLSAMSAFGTRKAGETITFVTQLQALLDGED